MKHYGSLPYENPYTYQLLEGSIVGGRLVLVVVIHETSVDVNTKYWHHIALELAFPTA